MHVNHSVLGQAVFKVAVFRLDASVKTSSPLPDCRGKISNINTNVTNYVMLTQKLQGKGLAVSHL